MSKGDDSKDPKDSTVTCYRCGGPHLATQCKHKDVVCHFCKKKGHFASVCRAKAVSDRAYVRNQESSNTQEEEPPKPTKQANQVEEELSSEDDIDYNVYTLSTGYSNPYIIQPTLNSVPVKMELDTGAAVSLICESTYKEIQRSSPFTYLQPVERKLHTYTGTCIEVLGIFQVHVRCKDKHLLLPIHVVHGGGPNLMVETGFHTFEVDLKDAIPIDTSSHVNSFPENCSSMSDPSCAKDPLPYVETCPLSTAKELRSTTVVGSLPIIELDQLDSFIQCSQDGPSYLEKQESGQLVVDAARHRDIGTTQSQPNPSRLGTPVPSYDTFPFYIQAVMTPPPENVRLPPPPAPPPEPSHHCEYQRPP